MVKDDWNPAQVVQGLDARGERRVANRKEVERRQFLRTHIRPRPRPDAHADINVRRVEIGHLNRCVDSQLHAGMGRMKASEARHQPFGRQHGRDRDGQNRARTDLNRSDGARFPEIRA